MIYTWLHRVIRMDYGGDSPPHLNAASYVFLCFGFHLFCGTK